MKIVGTKEGVDKARHIVQTISDEQVNSLHIGISCLIAVFFFFFFFFSGKIGI